MEPKIGLGSCSNKVLDSEHRILVLECWLLPQQSQSTWDQKYVDHPKQFGTILGGYYKSSRIGVYPIMNQKLELCVLSWMPGETRALLANSQRDHHVFENGPTFLSSNVWLFLDWSHKISPRKNGDQTCTKWYTFVRYVSVPQIVCSWKPIWSHVHIISWLRLTKKTGKTQ